MAMPFVLGIDGGGSSSRAVAVTVEGELLGEVDGGPLNYNTTSPGEFRASLRNIIRRFSDEHGVDPVAEQTVIGTASLFTSPELGEAASVCGELLPQIDCRLSAMSLLRFTVPPSVRRGC